MQPVVGFLFHQLPLLQLEPPVPLLIYPSLASAHGFLGEVVVDSFVVAVAEKQWAVAVLLCDPSCPPFVEGLWGVHQDPTVGLLAEVVHQLLAGDAAELELATETEGHPAAYQQAFPVAVGLT